MKRLYLTPFGILISFILKLISVFTRPFMVYGYFSRNGKGFLKYTRISSTATIVNPKGLVIGDNCWVWHHSIIDASNGVVIGCGVQIGAFVGIFTHSSHVSIRLLGSDFINTDAKDRIGYIRSPVIIGDYTFIATGAVIMPGAEIGKGCIIGVGAVVKGKIPDYSIVAGNPGKVVGSADTFDKRYVDNDLIARTYFDPLHFTELKKSTLDSSND